MMAAAAGRMGRDGFGSYQPTSADVFVCAGFKSGTTWLLQIATQIAFRGEAEFGNIGYMLRRGRSGSAGELLTPAMQRRIDDTCRAQLRELGCDFPYDDEFDRSYHQPHRP